MEKGIQRKEIALSIVDLLVVVFLISCMVYFIIGARTNNLSHPVSTGWIVNVTGENGEVTESDVDLDLYSLPRDAGRVSEIRLTRLMSKRDLNASTLRIYSMISDVRIYLANKKIYDSKQSENRGIEMSRGYSFVELPHQDNSAVIAIEVTATDDAGLASIPGIALTDSGKAYRFFVHERWFSIIISFFMFIFGLVLTLLSVVFVRLNNDYERLLHIGLFSVFTSIWLMSTQDALLLFGVGPDRSSGAGYLSITLAFLPLLELDLLTRKHMSTREVKLVKHVIAINMVVAAILAVLHFGRILSYVALVPVIHAVVVIDCLILIFAGSGRVREMELDERIYHYGMIYVISMGFVYIGLYDLRVYARIIPMRTSEIWFPAVTFSFLIVLVISYLVHLYGMLLNQAEEEVLTRLAYNDALTGLFNRVKAEEEFKRLDETGEKYALVDLDLNGLKEINDECGHAQGDVLISAFGHILQEVFGESGICVRMGGDEFLVIVRDEFMGSAEELVEKLVAREKEESENQPFEIDAAYGVIKSTEMENPRAEQLFSMVDKRMYDMKQASKKGREG